MYCVYRPGPLLLFSHQEREVQKQQCIHLGISLGKHRVNARICSLKLLGQQRCFEKQYCYDVTGGMLLTVVQYTTIQWGHWTGPVQQVLSGRTRRRAACSSTKRPTNVCSHVCHIYWYIGYNCPKNKSIA